MKKVSIAYNSEMVQLKPKDIHEFQGDLKELTKDNFNKLAHQIKKTGFAFAPFVWQNPKDKKWHAVDGHQRLRVIRELMKRKEIDPIENLKCVQVYAKTLGEAKERVLQAASQFGTVTTEGLYEFAKQSELPIDMLKQLHFQSVNVDSFIKGFADEKVTTSKIGKTMKDFKAAYDPTQIRQMLLVMNEKEFGFIDRVFSEIMTEQQFDNNTSVVNWLCQFYDKNKAKKG